MAYEIVVRVGPAMMSRIPFALSIGLALGVVACRKKDPDLGSFPQELPDLDAVAGGTDDCNECIHNEFGQCRFEAWDYCPGGPRGVDEACAYFVPCEESCCDRFPIVGGVALVRPGRQLLAREPQR